MEWRLRCTGKQYISLQHVWHSAVSPTCSVEVYGCSQHPLHAAKETGLFIIDWCAAQAIFVQMNIATKRGVVDNYTELLPKAESLLAVKLRHLLFHCYLKRLTQILALSLTVNRH